MKVEIRRLWETPRSITGELWIDGQFQCFTLEPARSNPVNPGHPCIQAGTYKVIFTHSPHLGYITPELVNVPGRSDIRWHIANEPKEVLGCVAVGEKHSLDWVANSAFAFKKLMTLLRTSTDGIAATYLDPPQERTLLKT